MMKIVILTGSYNLHGTSNTIVGKGCGTVGMIPDHFYKAADELGKKSK